MPDAHLYQIALPSNRIELSYLANFVLDVMRAKHVYVVGTVKHGLRHWQTMANTFVLCNKSAVRDKPVIVVAVVVARCCLITNKGRFVGTVHSGAWNSPIYYVHKTKRILCALASFIFNFQPGVIWLRELLKVFVEDKNVHVESLKYCTENSGEHKYTSTYTDTTKSPLREHSI